MDLFAIWLIIMGAISFSLMLGYFIKENKKAAR